MLGGLTSFGRGCNDGGVYTRTSFYYNWIVQILPQNLFTRGDDNSASVSINFNFNYFGGSYSTLNISTNGYVYFDSSNSIYALSYDLDTRYRGGIYYQNLNSQSNDFNSIKSDINRLNPSFNPTNIFRIKYDNVPAYNQNSSIASFQITLATNGSSSYVLVKYTSCLSGNTLTKTPGIYYTLSNGQTSSSTFSNPCSSSNVKLSGTWVFDVSA